ncbi:MAG: response regulator [Gilvibacter sp.]
MQKWYFHILFLCLFICPAVLGQDASFDNFQELSNSTRTYFSKRIDSANVLYNSGDYQRSLPMSIDILREAIQTKNPYIIHLGYRNVAYDYLAITDTVQAQETFIKSQKFAQKSKNDTAIALTDMDLANVYSIIGKDYTKAFEYHYKSIDGFNKIKDSTRLLKAHYNLVLTAMDAKSYRIAYKHIMKVKELSDYYEHDSFVVGIDNLLAEYYFHKKEYTTADRYFVSAIKEAKAKNYLLELEIAYKNYSDNLFAQKKYKEAFEAREQYEDYFDQNLEKINLAESGVLSAKFKIDEYKKDVLAAEQVNKVQLEKVENKSKWNNYLITLFIMSLFFIVLMFFAYRNRKQLVQELKSKNKEYLAAKEMSDKMSRTKTKFFSTVSHELRTPLYGVIGLSTLLLEDKGLKKHKKDLSLLKFSADYLLALINDVLQINKLDSKSLKDDCGTFNVQDLLQTLLGSLEYMRLQNNNRFHLRIDPAIPQSLRGNSMRLSQILMNLISNACKFTEDGDIYIEITQTQQDYQQVTLEFTIKDTGIGIAPEKHQSIFEEFSQIDSNNYQYQGTGLGLPIVKKLLALSNSDIQLNSNLGEGSTFSFEISLERTQLIKEPLNAHALDTRLLNGKRILIVEDNRINQIVTKKILEKDAVTCTLAENGNQAISMIKKEAFDLVLMDINMPEKDGLEATKEIRIFNKTIPIIALTAVEIEEVRYSIFEAGMNGIIVKPYDITQFKHVILANIIQGGQNQLDNHLEAI